MGKKLYCGNLSYKLRSDELEQLFSNYGTVVSAQVIEDRETGRSKASDLSKCRPIKKRLMQSKVLTAAIRWDVRCKSTKHVLAKTVVAAVAVVAAATAVTVAAAVAVAADIAVTEVIVAAIAATVVDATGSH